MVPSLLTLPQSDTSTWLSDRTRGALERARECVAEIKTGGCSPLETLGLWNDLEIAVSGAGAAAGVFSELHPDAAARSVAEETLQELERFTTAMSLDAELYHVFQRLDTGDLDPVSLRLLEEILRNFRRSGVDRDEATRTRLAQISERMVEVGQEFSRNIRADVRSITVAAEDLRGLPEDWVAQRVGADGTAEVTTEYPDAIPFFTFAEDPRARLELRKQFLNRGWPKNDAVLQELFALRREFAALVGYENWADYDAEVKMIGSGSAIKEFIDSVATRAGASAKRDYEILLERVRQDDPEADSVSLADKDYYVELVRRERFGVDSAQVREYFRLERVIDGILDLTRDLFGIHFTAVSTPVWHEDVRAYDVALEDDGQMVPLGRAYLDLHPRDGKFGHAAQFTLVNGIAGRQLAEGVLGCNFGRGLLEHDDVVTLFHEFGHLLHHLLAGRGAYMEFAGVATEWDFVEAPSQMLEEWAWDHGVLSTFALNDDGEVIPLELVERMRAAKEFGKGFDALTQMFYAAMSYIFHVEQVDDLTTRMQELQAEYSMFAHIPGTHMIASFGHLDGYSSGYYTYMWSLTIAKDMFSRFSSDLMDREAARAYRDEVLAAGGSRDAADLIEAFLGRPYSLDAFEEWLSA